MNATFPRTCVAIMNTDNVATLVIEPLNAVQTIASPFSMVIHISSVVLQTRSTMNEFVRGSPLFQVCSSIETKGIYLSLKPSPLVPQGVVLCLCFTDLKIL